MWSRIERVVRLDGLNFFIVHHHFVKFSSHRPCGSSDTIAKKVNVTLQDYVTTRLYGKKLLTVYLHPVTKLIAIEIVLVDIYFFSLPSDITSDITRPRGYMVMWLYG